MYGKEKDYEKEKLELERYLLVNQPINCELCNSKLFYVGSGRYRCDKCKHDIG